MSGRPTARVLLVGDDYYATLATLRGLRAGGYEPWLATATLPTYGSRSRASAGAFLVPDPEDAAVFAGELAAIAARIGAAVLLPGTEPALHALAGRDALFPGVAVGIPSGELVARATSKLLLAELAAEAGLATPPTRTLAAADPAGLPRGFELPLVLKPERSAGPGGRVDTRLVGSAEELAAAVAAAPGARWLVQPFLAGTLGAVSGVAREGETLCTLHQVARRIFPLHCGPSAYAETVPADPELDRAVRRFIGLLGWTGVFEVQVVRSGGTAHLIDLNPRPYGTLALAIAAGHNLPALWADVALGRTPAVPAYRTGVRLRVEPRELRALARGALGVLVPRRRTAHAVFSWRDPAPVLELPARALRAGRRRFATTL